MEFRRAILRRCRRIFPFLNRQCVVVGIETSCDDTACAVVNNKREVLGECVESQHGEVLRLGGIMPMIAKQWHEKSIEKVVNTALENAHLTVQDVDAVAVTIKPGLVMSLLVGMNYAKYLTKKFEKPLIPIHHMEAHALTARLLNKEIEYPFLTFLISGGHCILAVVKSVDEFITLGRSTDDAPGEVFDKVSRRLKLHNLPQYRNKCGGAAVEDMAKTGNTSAFHFPVPFQKVAHCNFSFSGIKSQAMRSIACEEEKYGGLQILLLSDAGLEGDQVLPNADDFCAGFQYSVMKHMCMRLQRAIEFIELEHLLPCKNKFLVVSGGAASNSFLCRAFDLICKEKGYHLYVPPPKYCSDNGVMIAWNGVERYQADIGIIDYDKTDDIRAKDKFTLGEDLTPKIMAAKIKCNWIKLNELENNTSKPQAMEITEAHLDSAVEVRQ